MAFEYTPSQTRYPESYLHKTFQYYSSSSQYLTSAYAKRMMKYVGNHTHRGMSDYSDDIISSGCNHIWSQPCGVGGIPNTTILCKILPGIIMTTGSVIEINNEIEVETDFDFALYDNLDPILSNNTYKIVVFSEYQHVERVHNDNLNIRIGLYNPSIQGLVNTSNTLNNYISWMPSKHRIVFCVANYQNSGSDLVEIENDTITYIDFNSIRYEICPRPQVFTEADGGDLN